MMRKTINDRSKLQLTEFFYFLNPSMTLGFKHRLLSWTEGISIYSTIRYIDNRTLQWGLHW